MTKPRRWLARRDLARLSVDRATFPIFVLELSPEAPIVRADPTQIEQVLMNLCLNSRDAMAKGGELTIKTEMIELGPDLVITSCLPTTLPPRRWIPPADQQSGTAKPARTIL